MSKNLQKSLDNLLEGIFKTKEYKDYKQAEENWKKAKKSQKLLSDYLKARNTLGIYKEGNFSDMQGAEKKVLKLEKEVKADKDLNDWIVQQNNFQDFIWKQTGYLSKKLKFPFSQKPSCGSCC